MPHNFKDYINVNTDEYLLLYITVCKSVLS